LFYILQKKALETRPDKRLLWMLLVSGRWAEESFHALLTANVTSHLILDCRVTCSE